MSDIPVRSLAVLLCLVASLGCDRAPRAPRAAATGPYLGQRPPGDEPELFAPGLVSTGLFERDLAITPDGAEIYFSICGPDYAYSTILVTRRAANGEWSAPEPAPFSAVRPYRDVEPFVTPDGARLLFVSDRPLPAGAGVEGGHHIWAVERTSDGWSAAAPLPAPVLAAGEQYFPTVTRDGTLYFTSEGSPEPGNWIVRCRPSGSGWSEPEVLPAQVNAGRTRFNAAITPDESALLLSIVGLPDGRGRSDYYVCFRSPDDAWSGPVNLGERVNRPGSYGYSPALSPDGRYFFFMSTRAVALEALAGRTVGQDDGRELAGVPGNGNPDIWWVDAAFLEQLRAAAPVSP